MIVKETMGKWESLWILQTDRITPLASICVNYTFQDPYLRTLQSLFKLYIVAKFDEVHQYNSLS